MNTNNTINGFCFDIITEQNIKINHIDNIKSNIDIHYLIYQIDNTINGKYYIGQHHTNNPLDNYMGSGKQIISAIKKYGVENFVKTILFDFETFEEMNNKEKELLPLSQCYPQNKMSYNLCEGGTTKINKFAGKTDEELRTIRQKIKTTRDNWSEEKRAIVKQHQSNAVHQRYVNMSDEQLKEISKQMSNIMVNTHKNRTSEEQLEINKKISFARKNFSDEKKTEIYLKKKTTIDNWSEEKKKQVHEKRSLSAKNAQQNMSLETRQQSVDKWKQTMNNKTYEEKQKIVQKYLDTMNNKSDEEKRAISKKRSQTLLNRSEEEKQACINKIKKTRSEWSNEKRKSIYENQSRQILGRKRMNNGKHEISIKPKDIQKYLNLGYVFGRLKK